jgi:hypothetical protein
MFFEGATIFSYGYHFHIARFVNRKRKGQCVLFTTQSYSSSTGGHKNIARSALRGLNVPVFNVHDVRNDPTAADIKKAQVELNNEVDAFARSTPYDLERQVASYQASADKTNEMAEFFGLRQRVTCPAISDEVIAKVQARIAKRDLRRSEKTARDAIRRAAQWARDKAEYIEGGRHDLYADGDPSRRWGLSSTLTDDEHAAHLAAYTIIQADKVAAWRAGKPVVWGWNETAPAGTMLRVKGDDIQTSRGAEFPVSHGRKAFQMIAECRATGRFWEKNGHSIPLGTFHIDRIDADGTVHAGCHVVTWPEIEHCARELGIVS